MEAKEIIFAVLFFAILIEGTVEYVKLAIQKSIYWEIIVAFAVSLVATIGYDLDFVKALIGIEPSIPYLGNVVSALVVSRGSNYVFDLVGKFTGAVKEMDSLLEGEEARPVGELNPDIVSHEDIDGVG